MIVPRWVSGARRYYGTGSLIEHNGAYYGKWRVGSRQIKRKLGPKRKAGTSEGLTKSQAESALRKRMTEPTEPPVIERVTVADVADRRIAHLQAVGRKPSTLRSYSSILETRIKPTLGECPIYRVSRQQVEQFRTDCLRGGLSPKSTSNCLGLLHSIFEFAIERGWATENPTRYLERPRAHDKDDLDVRFLEAGEVEALLRAVPDSDYGRVQRVSYLAALMTGMRQGELLALRWLDVDWEAQRIRVRRNYVRGQFGTPKSKRGRSVPLADRLGGELDRLYQDSAFEADEDLVFASPHTGRPMNGNSSFVHSSGR